MNNNFINYHTITFCTMTNKCTIISQIITPLHFVLWPTNAQIFHILSHHYILYCDLQMHNYFTIYHIITFCIMTNKCRIISQIITPLHFVLRPTNAQLFHKLSHHYNLYCDQEMHNYFTNYHTVTFCTMANKCTITSQIITLLHFVLSPKNAQLFYKLSHHYILYCDQQMHNYFVSYHTITFSTMSNKCTIIS